MSHKRTYILTGAPIGLLAVVLGYHPGYLLALLCGTLVPNIDTVDSRVHRSWLFHTYLAPTIIYVLVSLLGLASLRIVSVLHFLTLGMTAHFVCDYVYLKNQTHNGAAWPVRPTFWSAPWGLMWLGLAWFAQWFLYLAPSFIPWVIGVPT